MSTGSIFYPTPIIKLNDGDIKGLFVKREDMIPYSFGGNKARKALLFFEEIDAGGYDCVVTYGSSHSNHCRVVANMAAERKLPCYIIGPAEVSDITFNGILMEMLGANISIVPVDEVSKTIDDKLNTLKELGKKPYFIAGGGHGKVGTQAYVNCYSEIKDYEKSNNIFFDYIFFASGTGTTHAGLVCGQILNNDDRMIIGISIARKNPRGREVVVDSIREYLGRNDDKFDKMTVFLDDYIGDGYGKDNDEINQIINDCFLNYGIPLDSTYTAKAFLGMKKYVREHGIENKKILFIHTGGTPLFFDDISKR